MFAYRFTEEYTVRVNWQNALIDCAETRLATLFVLHQPDKKETSDIPNNQSRHRKNNSGSSTKTGERESFSSINALFYPKDVFQKK